MEKLLVQNILAHPQGFEWQVQGLGMLRVYLDDRKKHRLHIWDSSLRIPNVSPIHNHPWDLHSTVIAGQYEQYRFIEADAAFGIGREFNKVTIKCGEEACPTSVTEKVYLARSARESYSEGTSYSQHASEIHFSCPLDGTVTLVKRTPKDDPDHAVVYWEGDGGWVNAAPRPATEEEIQRVTNAALSRWFW